MKNYFIVVCLVMLAGCANGYTDMASPEVESTSNATDFPISRDNAEDRSEDHVVSNNQFVHLMLEPPCKPDRFLADEIPSGYKINPDCPPEIIWPPRIIFKWDPGPVIR